LGDVVALASDAGRLPATAGKYKTPAERVQGSGNLGRSDRLY
jgi:hypothetical protein